MATEVMMPQLGQAMVTGVIIAWHVKDGEHVSTGAPLLTIESDKAAFDIESPGDGILRHFLPEGAEADVGAVLATILARGEAVNKPAAGDPSDTRSSSRATGSKSTADPGTIGKAPASPRARAAAAGRIDLAEVTASSADGIITAADVEQAIAAKGQAESKSTQGRRNPLTAAHRSAINRLQQSWMQAPHIVQMVEVDATRMAEAQALMRSGAIMATLNDLIIQAAADTMAEFGDLNAHIKGDEIIYSDQVDVSIAVATERGLRTPVLRSVAGLTLSEVAEKTRTAIDQARSGRADGGRASLTISNLGRLSIRCGTPVLNLDEAVLLFIGDISERPVVRDGAIVARHGTTLSIAFDHRIVDGLRAAEFSSALRRRLEKLDIPELDQGLQGPVHSGRSVRLISSAGLRCDLVDASGHRWLVDEPTSIGGTNQGPDPITSVLGALGSCLAIAFRLTAKRRRVPIDRVEASIGTEQDAKVRSISIRLDIWSSAPTADVEALLKPAKSACYVHDMLRPDLDLDVQVNVRGDAK